MAQFEVAVMIGLLADRPAASAGTVGRLYHASDEGKLYRDNGTGWDLYATALQLGTTATTAAAGNDARLSDARTPLAHKASHATGGTDALTPADIGAEPALGNPASNGYLLSSTAAGVRSWVAAPSGGLTNPMTTQDDLIVGGSAGAPARLAKGSDGQVLTVDPATHHLVWATPASALAQVATVNFVIDGSGSAIATGIKGDLIIPFTGTIQSVTLLADQAGSIVVDLWRDSYANYPPDVADSITDSSKPTLSSAAKSRDTTLSGWNKSVSAGDVIRVNVDSASTVQRVTLALTIQRTA